MALLFFSYGGSMISPTTELDAINTMLSTIGEAPISTVEDSGVVDAVMARQILRTVDREVQARGWHWNTDKGYPLTPNEDGECELPNGVLRCDTVSPDDQIDVVVRGKRLYDRRNHTYQINKMVRVDMVTQLPFEELPEAARQYITVRASRIFQERVLGSVELSKFSSIDETRAPVTLKEMEADTADYNILCDNYSVYRVLDR